MPNVVYNQHNMLKNQYCSQRSDLIQRISDNRNDDCKVTLFCESVQIINTCSLVERAILGAQ